MVRLFRRSGRKPGNAPGTIIHLGERKTEISKIQIIDYNKNQLTEKEIENIEECYPFFNKPTISWVNFVGLHQVEVIEKVGKQLSIHPLILEDILNTDQHPKVENYDDFIFLVLKMFQFDEVNNELKMEHMSIICGTNFVLSFTETENEVFEPVRVRIREGRKTLRQSKSDYLMYVLVDAIVDNYFIVLEKIGEKIEELEKRIVQDPKPENLSTLHKLQDDMLVIQKMIMPLRRLIPTIERLQSPLISKSNAIFFRDVGDHLTQITYSIETINNKLTSMNSLYLSVIGQKTNEVMKLLALIATIFIPITFLAGVYGMNFQFMPELSSPIAYPMVLTAMTIIGISILFYFKKRKLW